MEIALTVAAVVAWQPACLRWLRVAQREHYLPGSVTRFASRWWFDTPLNATLGVLGLGSALLAWFDPSFGFLAAAVVAYGPKGLGVRGRTSKLAWTRRLKTLVAVAVAIDVVVLVAGAVAGAPGPVAVALAVLHPLVIDAALAVTRPLEERFSARFVEQATRKLRSVGPTTVAITGSYGKTTTKGYVRHLLTTSRTVVASPASFNNTAGLSRAVNEHLAPGTDVFVAAMGTYGPGEIRRLCSWVQPDVSVITAIGPVHLERMGSIEGIVRAKSEILEGVDRAVLNVDAPHLAGVAAEFASRGKVVRCSGTDPSADVFVAPDGDDLVVRVGGEEIGRVPGLDARPTNVACAVGVAVALDAPLDLVGRQLASLPVPEHRQQVVTAPSGVTVIDDTFNANPAGARAGLDLLARHAAAGGKRIVVTPGMVELGPVQDEENRAFAAAAAAEASHLLVVGRTNQTALLEGARGGSAEVVVVGTRDEAVAWVRENAAQGDAVLYENDLPDHYP